MAFSPTKRTKDLLLWMLSTKMMRLWRTRADVPAVYLARLLDTHFGLIVVLCLSNLPS
jgi:hypothetical protein